MRVMNLLWVLLIVAVPGCAGQEPPEVGGGATRPPLEPGGTEIRGELGGDADMEGGCAWIETDDGTRYEVLYPDGYTVQFDPVRLLNPDGQVVAEEGERVEAEGTVADDVASRCQVGPLWRADDVELDRTQDAS